MTFYKENLVHLINQKYRFLNKELNEALNEFGLYHSQWTIIYSLYKKGAMTQTAIWQYLNVEAPTVTRTVKKLEENGWVARIKGEDKRQNIINLTSKSHMKIHAIKNRIESFENEALKGLSKHEQENLKNLLQKIGPEERTDQDE
ncbi:hypothetical protein CIL05_13650 [Virgibacillus profundi]|uniref:HTH marR-type domain-containing protein n=1 Tax=Virgibacillus profundi TaxID=2024555 RepID=A0A2A2ID15_9BACI|nr:MarR family transcriptional regulator [Virgibacillus profundi]PAV29020.1 hypothetical protein CIL05_13650 [Virgibacillus profundi]PXY53189.1 MarR family transcriptional regulator [Virgibacillus profundi]